MNNLNSIRVQRISVIKHREYRSAYASRIHVISSYQQPFPYLCLCARFRMYFLIAARGVTEILELVPSNPILNGAANYNAR
jgi:hypothetical protein